MLVKLYYLYSAGWLEQFGGGSGTDQLGFLKNRNFALKIQKRDQNLDNFVTELTSLGIN